MKSARIFVLIGGDEIDARVDGGTPADARRVKRFEVVAGRPSHSLAVFGRMTVQRVKANPESGVMRGAHPQTQSIGVLRRPIRRVVLPLRFDDAPGIVRPAEIVRRGESAWLARHSAAGGGGLHGAKEPEARSNRHCVVKRRLLSRVGPSENEYGTQRQRLDALAASAARGAVVSHSSYSPSSVQIAAKCCGWLSLKSRFSVMSGHCSRDADVSARVTIGRMRSKKSRSVGSSPVKGSPCDTIECAGVVAVAGRHTRSCSMASGVPVASARSIRSFQRP